MKAGRPLTPRAAMDASPSFPESGSSPPVFLGSPQAEVLEDVLREQFGPLPQLAAICRLKRLRSGGYSSTEDLQLVLERRRVANAKERERVRGSPGPPGAVTTRPCPGRELTSRSRAHHQTFAGPPCIPFAAPSCRPNAGPEATLTS